MGLDAWVWCNCVETGQLVTPHPFPDLLYIDEEGSPCIRSNEDEKVTAHDEWMYGTACHHEDCILLHHRLGNISLVAILRKAISDLSDDAAMEYPILWSQVIFSGTHCGDWLKVAEVIEFKVELNRLRSRDLSQIKAEDAQFLRDFLQQMDELIQASLSINKPIVF